MNHKIREEILRKRPVCELCWEQPATQLHHCLVHDNKRLHNMVTVPENLMPVCEKCHTSGEQKANGIEVKMAFAKRQVELGYHISMWYWSLPLKFKESWLLHAEDKVI